MIIDDRQALNEDITGVRLRRCVDASILRAIALYELEKESVDDVSDEELHGFLFDTILGESSNINASDIEAIFRKELRYNLIDKDPRSRVLKLFSNMRI
jgi:hypothetical protein